MDRAAEPTTRRARTAPEDFLLGGILCLAVAALVSYRLWDGAVADYFRLSERISSRNRWLLAVGELGKPLALAWLLLLWAWAAKRPRLILAALLALALVGVLVQAEKQIVGRIRPDQKEAEVLQQPWWRRSYSFPSGDAASAFAVAAVATAFIASGRGRWIPFLLAAIVGLTRLCLLRHYLSDVCMGAAIGALCGYFALRISSGKLSRAPPWWRAASGIAVVLFLAADAVVRGPVTWRFLPVFAPVIVVVLALAKGRAWLRWAGRRARKRSSSR